jgi:CDP-6-deoxy-D-xylo-4-hexulose-3-dehydrase
VIPVSDWKANREQYQLVHEVLASGRLTYGPMTREFESQFARMHKWETSVFTNSGTNALKIALAAYKELDGWKDGDEVIIPAVTFIATYNAVRAAGLTPVLVDVGEDFNIDTDAVMDALNSRTRAVVPVHLLGRPARMDEIMVRRSARRPYEVRWQVDVSRIRVIEDSCESMFLDTGPKGDAACYSTYVAHHLVTGVGGLIATNDRQMETVARSLMFHGRDPEYLALEDNAKPDVAKHRFRFPRHGYSDRATELEAALGLGGLSDAYNNAVTRRRNAQYLAARLDVEFVRDHAYMFFPLMVPDRDGLMAHLEARGIATRELMPLTNQPVFAGKYNGLFPMAERINREGLLLPCHPYLTVADLDFIVSAVREFRRRDAA